MAPLLDLGLQGLELNLAGPTVRQINAAIYYSAGCTAHAKVVLPKKDSCVQHEIEQGLRFGFRGFLL